VTFLKKLGTAILKGIQVVSGIAPVVVRELPGIAGTVQTISTDLAQVAQIIVAAEAFGQSLGLPGTQKLTAASPQVAQIIMQSSLLAGKKIANPELFNAGCTQIAAGMADVLNSLHESGVRVESLS
jgi:hypothetical protein